MTYDKNLKLGINLQEKTLRRIDKRFLLPVWSFRDIPFPEMTYDKKLKDQFEKDSGHTNKIFTPQGERDLKKVRFRSPEREGHYAARILYYGDGATVGLTYFKGFSPLPYDFSQASLLSNVTLQSKEQGCYNGPCGDFEKGDVVDIINVVQETRFDEMKGLGFELMKTVGAWSWKWDVMSLEESFEGSSPGTSFLPKEGDSRSGNPNPDAPQPGEDYKQNVQAFERYWSWVLNENGGRLSVPRRNIFFRFGF